MEKLERFMRERVDSDKIDREGKIPTEIVKGLGEIGAFGVALFALFTVGNYLYGRYRWPWISDLYEYIQTIYLLPAVLSVIANPSKPTFKVTSKNEGER